MKDKDKQIINRLDQIHSEVLMESKNPDGFIKTFMNVAYAFEGLEELPGNRGFWHDQFARSINQPLGIPYCMAWIDFVAKTAASFMEVEDPLPANTASSQSFFEWAKRKHLLAMSPDFGHIAIWRDAKSWKGHVGIVTTEFDKKQFYSIEANTSSPLSQWRDGRYVMIKSHPYTRVGQIAKGRWLRGFVDMRAAFIAANT